MIITDHHPQLATLPRIALLWLLGVVALCRLIFGGLGLNLGKAGVEAAVEGSVCRAAVLRGKSLARPSSVTPYDGTRGIFLSGSGSSRPEVLD